LRRLAIELNTGDNTHLGKEIQERLLQPHAELVELAGLVLVYFPDGESLAFPTVDVKH